MHQIVMSSGFCSHYPKMGFASEHAIKIRRPVVVFQPIPVDNYVQLLVHSSIVYEESARHSFGHTRLQPPAFKKFADLSNVSVDT